MIHERMMWHYSTVEHTLSLRIAFKWMVRAFSGYLSTDQLLLLWDRILGYDSLEIVAVLAAAVFAFRAENLMEVTSLTSAEAVLADLSTLKVMPLIQIFLFATVIWGPACVCVRGVRTPEETWTIACAVKLFPCQRQWSSVRVRDANHTVYGIWKGKKMTPETLYIHIPFTVSKLHVPLHARYRNSYHHVSYY